MSIFKIEEMTEEKAIRMEKDLTERLESLKDHQKLSNICGGFNSNNFEEQIKQTEKELQILNTEYTEYFLLFLLFINICILKVGVFGESGIII